MFADTIVICTLTAMVILCSGTTVNYGTAAGAALTISGFTPLTVTLDDFTGRTRVHAISGGGGEGLFRFDWGAAETFEGVVQDALSGYRL